MSDPKTTRDIHRQVIVVGDRVKYRRFPREFKQDEGEIVRIKRGGSHGTLVDVSDGVLVYRVESWSVEKIEGGS